MKIAYFTHSLVSCWNHGNVHFLRGVLRELISAGHQAAAFEPKAAWSLVHLLKEHGETAVNAFHAAYPDLSSTEYDETVELGVVLAPFDLVIVHEWNEPWLVAAIGRLRRQGARFTALFHDTHHRAVSDPDAIRRFDLNGYDGVLAFGQTLADIYRQWGWGERVFVWHEAADTRLFRPATTTTIRTGLVWIGNWGDDERSRELEEYLLRPAQHIGIALDVYGVRYPQTTRRMLDRYGAFYRGWLANTLAPSIFARHLATIHVPRRFYVDNLPGIPTIRVFEALACGIPLLSSPWSDCEGLFHRGEDYLVARNGDEMQEHIRAVTRDRDLAGTLVANGLATIGARHSCAHRAAELLAIVDRIHSPARLEIAR